MLPISFVIKLDRILLRRAAEAVFVDPGGSGGAEICEPRVPTISIRAVESPADREGVAAVARRCRETDPDLAGRFAPEGLLSEIAERPGRRGRGWVAWQRDGTDSDGTAGGAKAVGMLILVEAHAGTRPETHEPSCVRFSVAWLLVDPAMRRRGLATALVGEAVRHVRSRGGTELEAQTLAGWAAAAAFWRCLADASTDPGSRDGHRSTGTRGA